MGGLWLVACGLGRGELSAGSNRQVGEIRAGNMVSFFHPVAKKPPKGEKPEEVCDKRPGDRKDSRLHQGRPKNQTVRGDGSAAASPDH